MHHNQKHVHAYSLLHYQRKQWMSMVIDEKANGKQQEEKQENMI